MGSFGARLTKDDERARRICSLAVEFMNAGAPVASSDVARTFYPSLSPDSFRRAFSRDRQALAACGVVLREVRGAGRESLWQADEEGSFAGGTELGALDAAALGLACRPLLDNGSWAFAGELRLALAKLTRAFSEASVAPSRPGTRKEPRALATLRACLVSGEAARVTYTDAAGRTSERLIAPYAFFELRDSLYLVAGRLDGAGQVEEGGTRTYRVDRFEGASPVSSVSFEVPDDFCIQDWRRLPFQIGDALLTATFEVPGDRKGDFRRAPLGQGRLTSEGGRLLWEVPVADVGAAASWAVSQGIRPVSPRSLVESWRHVLEGVLGDAR